MSESLHLINEYIMQIDAETLEREAALVAAAPDLLAALEDAIEALADANYYPSELKRMQSIITKAKGN